MTSTLLHGDCLDVLRTMPDSSVDSIVTDPPYDLVSIHKRFGKEGSAPAQYGRDGAFSRLSKGFMGKEWDGTGIAFRVELWSEVLRVLKPGGWLLSAGGSRTYHRMTCAIEDAGFEIRDCITHHYGSGFPKSHNVSKALAALPACSCGVSEVGRDALGIVEPSSPSSLGTASVGAEAGLVLLASSAADSTARLSLEPGSGTLGRQGQVQLGIEDIGGQLDPVVAGLPDVATVAEGDKVTRLVGGIETQPEALRDDVMHHEAFGASALYAATIAGDDVSGNIGPSAPFVFPFAPAPSGVAAAAKTPPVVGGHAVARAVLPALSPTAAFSTAEDAKVNPIAGTLSHTDHYTTERQALARCERCGGRIGDIPEGLGTALKPATEFWTVARKPLAESTVAAQVLATGTGAINVAATRVGTIDNLNGGAYAKSGTERNDGWGMQRAGAGAYEQPAGRWPPNLLLSHAPGCERVGVKRVKGTQPTGSAGSGGSIYGGGRGYTADMQRKDNQTNYADADGRETVEDWRCHPSCPVAELGRQSGESKSTGGGMKDFSRSTLFQGETAPNKTKACGLGDTGTAARYFPTFAPDDAALHSSELVAYNQASNNTGDTLWESTDQSQAILAASDTQAVRAITGSPSGTLQPSQHDKYSPTSGPGSKPTGQSLMATKSTTSTATSKTTGSTTSNLLMPSHISDSTAVANCETANGGSLAACAESSSLSHLSTGISAVRDGRSMDAAEPAISERSLEISKLAAPFKYQAKASRRERNAGLPAGVTSSHPTVKPLALMRWLCRLITPPGGTVLDPFLGSGSTGVAALEEGFSFVGIEQSSEYLAIAQARITHAQPSEREAAA